jgi:antitoxin (DNA-binding transcriptional repressor) of toxin-antitoxin stability system
MSSVSLEDAQAHLPELIDQLHPGAEITIVRGQTPVARLVPHGQARRQPPGRATARG